MSVVDVTFGLSTSEMLGFQRRRHKLTKKIATVQHRIELLAEKPGENQKRNKALKIKLDQLSVKLLKKNVIILKHYEAKTSSCFSSGSDQRMGGEHGARAFITFDTAEGPARCLDHFQCNWCCIPGWGRKSQELETSGTSTGNCTGMGHFQLFQRPCPPSNVL